MFKVSDDAKLRVQDPLHRQFEGSKVKASDYVVKVDGNSHDMDPEALLYACVNKVDSVQLTLQRDLANNVYRREREREIERERESESAIGNNVYRRGRGKERERERKCHHYLRSYRFVVA